jgi:polyisoprenoid-binding protein YceI
MKEMDVNQLTRWMDEKPRFLLLHVPSPESFREAHIPGAKNVCVYEMVFLDRVQEETKGNLDYPIVVYGISDEFMASKKAATLLGQAGYSDVSRLIGGLSAWQEAGESVEGVQADAVTLIADGDYVLDLKQSCVFWTGRNLANVHQGTLNFSAGTLEIYQGNLTRGYVAVDMTSLVCDDINDKTMNMMLLAHLSSDDFFAADEFPTAEFDWDHAEHLDVLPGQPNVLLRGQMTIRGHQEPLEIQGVQGFNADGECVVQSHFDLDRTRWNVQYGSGKIFESLAMHLVNDHISIGLRLVASPAAPS